MGNSKGRCAAIAAACALILLMALPQLNQAQNSCPCAPPPCCVIGGENICCLSIPGGGGGGGGTPQPGQTPQPGSTPTPGGGGGQPTPPPWAPPPTPTPSPADCYQIDCIPDASCRSEFGRWVVCYIGVAGHPMIVSKSCLPREVCIPPTPASPPPSSWPCDEPPRVEDGEIHQPCQSWPGYFIIASVRIPPSLLMVNPWPRSLNGLRTLFRVDPQTPTRVEVFSENVAKPCPGIDYNAEYSSSTFTCANGAQFTTGGIANIRIGVAWQRWTRGAGRIFGMLPPDEFVLLIPDRPWNGGDRLIRLGAGERTTYTFETSSWGLPENGPTWNPECQDRYCSCDERVQSHGGTPAYQVELWSYWWPEWTFSFDRYVCARKECRWGPCMCYPDEQYGGCERRECGDRPADCPPPKWWGQVKEEVCVAWKWEKVTDATAFGWQCDEAGAVSGWCKYDLRKLGRQPLVTWKGVQMAGADPNGNRCGSYHSYGNGQVAPVPVIESQPVKYP